MSTTLNRGTWFFMWDRNMSYLGEIIDYEEDSNVQGLHWFKCNLHYDRITNEEMREERTFSSRDFEQFRELTLMTPAEGQSTLQQLISHQGMEAAAAAAGAPTVQAAATPDADATDAAMPAVTEMPSAAQLHAAIAGRSDPEMLSATQLRASIAGRPDPEAVQPTQPTQPTPADAAVIGEELALTVNPMGNPYAAPLAPAARVAAPINGPAVFPAEVAPPPPNYINRQVFRPRVDNTDIPFTTYDTPLGSGNMKSVMALYESNPKDSWESVDKGVSQSSHQFFIYAGKEASDKIVQQKLDYLSHHKWLSMEINHLYMLSFDGMDTKCIYLGKNTWAMHPVIDNEIPGLVGLKYVNIFKDSIQYFTILKLDQDSTDNQAVIENIARVIENIDPNQLTVGQDELDEIYCKSDTVEDIQHRDITRAWEQALVYNYYTGAELDPRLDVKAFADQETLSSLATVREDTRVLELLT